MNLVIVDCQYDFCDPKGTLYVPRAEEVVKNIAKLLEHNNFSKVIFTVDWHEKKDVSFNINGGKWPVHCVQYSHGASIMDTLLRQVIDKPIDYEIIRKGNYPVLEEYGAFSYTHVIYPSNNKFDKQIWLQDSDDCCTVPYEPFVVCGVAGDYCVKETLSNLLQFKPMVYTKGIASIDDGQTLKEFIKENNLKEYDY